MEEEPGPIDVWVDVAMATVFAPVAKLTPREVERGTRVRITLVDLLAVNTPQFDWALNKMGRRPQPVPPIFEPEVPARAIRFAAEHDRRNVWVGHPTVQAILANRIAPGAARPISRQERLFRPAHAGAEAGRRAEQPCSSP